MCVQTDADDRQPLVVTAPPVSPASHSVRFLPSSTTCDDTHFDIEEKGSNAMDAMKADGHATCRDIANLFVIAICTFTIFISVGWFLGRGIGNHTIDTKVADDTSTTYVISKTYNFEIQPTIDTNAMSNVDQQLLSFLSSSSFHRDTVIDLIIEKYVSHLSPDTMTRTKLHSAMEAIHLVETDGDPVPISEHPFLFVGSIGEIC